VPPFAALVIERAADDAHLIRTARQVTAGSA